MEPVFDHTLFAHRQARARAQATAGADFLIRHVSADMAERLAIIERKFEHPVQVHGSSACTADMMEKTGRTAPFSFVSHDQVIGAGTRSILLAAPDEIGLSPESADLIVSPLALHMTNDTPGFLIQARRALVGDGLFLAAVPASGTLGELRQSLLEAESELTGGAHARVHPFADVRDYGALLQRAGFALPVADVEDITVRYDNMFALMRDLRSMGMTNVMAGRSRVPARRRLFFRAAEIYSERFADADGRIRATFSIIHLSGWAPHENQQKPLKPGSARTRLADALKTGEHKLPR